MSLLISFYPARGDLPKALRLQAIVVGALILREVRTRFGKDRIGYLWAVADPCLHIAVWFGLMWIVRQRHEMYGMHSALFLASGIIPLFFFQRVDRYVKAAISANQALLQYPLVKHPDLMIARFLLEAGTMIVVGIVVWGSLMALGVAALPDDLLALFPVSAAMLFLGFGFGAFNSVATILSPTYEKALGLSGRIIYLTSGIFFSVDSLPPQVVKWLALNPVCHGLSLFRSACFHSYQTTFASVWYILAWALALLLLGLAFERVFRGAIQER